MKITIVGTGTASWLSAFVLSHTTNHDITVIEAFNLPTIGVGEGSTAIFSDLIGGKYFKTNINLNDFTRELECTPKMAIDFKGWGNNDYYSPVDGTPTAFHIKDELFLQALAKDKCHISSQCGYNVEHNKLFGGAFHFNTNNFDKFIRPYCEKKNVKVIQGTVRSVIFNDFGNIKQLVLSDNSNVETDFVIDGTGFHRAIIKHLNYRWIDYVDNLPVNRAIPIPVKYDDLSKEEFNDLKPVTTAQRMSAGWLWKIPTTKRLGCGYVFSDEFISDSKAREEVNKLFGREMEATNAIPFKTGRLEKQLMKNCLAIGLSGAFAEPLQATSIHTTIVQIMTFAQTYCVEHLDEKMRTKFNNKMSKLYDDMRDFLVLHYATNKTDTKFWKMISEHKHLTPQVKEIIEYSKSAVPNFNTFDAYFGHVNHKLWNWTLAGLGYLTPKLAKQELENYDCTFNLDNEQKHFENITKETISLQEFLNN
tara:strand:+ start:308 stop:1738 length:1431 start_codon:yes stop_codon:yes gene_type:complete